MKKVLHVITTINRGGAENQLLILAKAQIQDGFQVEVIFLKGEPELMSEFEGIGATVNSTFYGTHPINQAFSLRNYLKDYSGIVHAHLPRAELMTAFSNHAFFFSRHNAEPFFPGSPRFISNALSKIVSHRAKAGIAISEAVRLFLLNSGEICSCCHLSVVYYGIESGGRIAGAAKNSSPNNPRIGTISRLVPQKDLETLMKAFAIVLSEFPKAELLIVGSGPLETSLKSLAKNLKIEKNTKWLGRTKDTGSFYANLDTFVLTSRYEGFGLVLLEAMSHQVPVVATNISAIPEVVGSNHPLISELSSPESFSRNILGSLSPSLRRKVIEFQDLRLPLFGTKRMVSELNRIYSGL
jgi:glycosyltransferase involved in cell wall biosynthesis